MTPIQFRSTVGASDAQHFITIYEASYEIDGISPTSPEEYRPSLEWYQTQLETSNKKDWVVIEQNSKIIAYGHALWNWKERDNTEVYLHFGFVKPTSRGLGIGTALIEKLELRWREKPKKQSIW